MLACALSGQRAGCDNASDIGLGAMLGRCAYNSQHYVSLVVVHLKDHYQAQCLCFCVLGEQKGSLVACQILNLCRQDNHVTVTAVC